MKKDSNAHENPQEALKDILDEISMMKQNIKTDLRWGYCIMFISLAICAMGLWFLIADLEAEVERVPTLVLMCMVGLGASLLCSSIYYLRYLRRLQRET